jgi:hypothetical protein
MSAMWAVQKSLYTALSSSSTFMTKISNNLWDEPPTNEQYPYVTIGSMTEANLNRLNKSGFFVTLEMRIFTTNGRGGFKLAKEILEIANDTINLKRFTLDNFTMVQVYYRYSSTERDEDKHIINANYDVICH